MRIMLIEDSKLIAESLEISLKNYNYIVHKKSYEDFIKTNCYVKDTKILIININFNITSKNIEKMKHQNPELCFIGLNTTKNWTKKLNLLEYGFDDVLDYPFPSKEIIIKIEKAMQKPKNTKIDHVVSTKNLRIDTRSKRVINNKNEIRLRKKEFCLLEYLVRNKNRTISRSELLDHVWDYNRINSSNTVDVHIKRLRDKMEKPDVIETVHGFGYRMNDN